MKTLILTLLITFACQQNKNQVISKDFSKNDLNENYPNWVLKIVNDKKISLKDTLNISKKFVLVDLNGDKIEECVILKEANILILFKNGNYELVNNLFSLSVFEVTIDELNWQTENKKWITDYDKSSKNSIIDYFKETQIISEIKGDGVDLLGIDGVQTIFYDGEKYICLFYD